MTYIEAMQALADPTRRAIVERLRGGPRSVGQLAQGVAVSRPAVSQHLRVLCAAGLLDVSAAGTRRLYRINPDGLVGLRAYLDDLWADALAAATAEDRPADDDAPGTG